MPDLSKRGHLVPPSPIRKLVPLAEAARKNGRVVYPLNIGQPDLQTPEAFFAAVRDFPSAVIAYANSEGTRELREAMQGYYRQTGLDVGAGEIIVTTGGSEAVLFALAAIADPGDQVVTFEPLYTNYRGFATILGIDLVAVRTRAEDGFHLPPADEIRRAIGPRTRGVLYCNPGNPTGTVFSRAEVETLVGLARERDLFLVADEVYREFVFEGTRALSALEVGAELGALDRVIIVDSISKRHSLCGARIGALVSKNEHVRAAALHMAQARLSSATLEQAGAAAVMSLPPGYYEGVRTEYRARRDVVYQALCAIPGTVCARPEGAFYVLPKLPLGRARRADRSSEALARFLLTEFSEGGETVMVAPGSGFYVSEGLGTDEVRIAYVLEVEKLARAMEVFRKGVEAFIAG